jgi:surfeit locus 1 family protein
VRRIVLLSLSLLLATACVGLGVWQLRRLSARRATNRAALLERALPPLQIDSTRPALRPNRLVRVTGKLDEDREFLLRGRVVQGVPAILVITPLRLAGSDTALLVNRGYVPSPDALDPGTAAWSEAGEHRFQGLLLPVPDRGDGSPLRHGGRETWKGLDLRAMRERLPYPVASLYLIAEADSAGGAAHTIRGRDYPFRAEPPPLDEGPHLMYAVQWFGIAAAILAFGIIFVWRGGPAQRTVD